jgi:hypothetical protein
MESKWWEYYTVRYFVGTVIGAVLVVFINSEPGSPFEARVTVLEASKETSFLGVGLVAALGFAFCYIASAPVLTLHAARAHLRHAAIKAAPFKFALVLATSSVLAIIGIGRILPFNVAVIAGLIVGLQVGLILLVVITRFAVVEKFYRQLAAARANAAREKSQPQTPGLEYITSYRHLREHGNAFMIVLLEGVLAYILVNSATQRCAVFVLALWLLPAATAWLFGTVLESRLVSKSLQEEA